MRGNISFAVAAGSLSLPLTLAGPVLAAPAQPSQCTGTYTKTIEAADAERVVGTDGNDLIFVGDANLVDAKGGDDCIVAGAANSVKAGGGNDVVVLSDSSNKVDAGAGNDKVYDNSDGPQLILGGTGNDLLNASGTSKIDGGGGTDECHNGDNGKTKNCEEPLVPTVLHALGLR